jgi:predicted aminopeptidase
LQARASASAAPARHARRAEMGMFKRDCASLRRASWSGRLGYDGWACGLDRRSGGVGDAHPL